jgi:hypothetical protein
MPAGARSAGRSTSRGEDGLRQRVATETLTQAGRPGRRAGGEVGEVGRAVVGRGRDDGGTAGVEGVGRVVVGGVVVDGAVVVEVVDLVVGATVPVEVGELDAEGVGPAHAQMASTSVVAEAATLRFTSRSSRLGSARRGAEGPPFARPRATGPWPLPCQGRRHYV